MDQRRKGGSKGGCFVGDLLCRDVGDLLCRDVGYVLFLWCFVGFVCYVVEVYVVCIRGGRFGGQSVELEAVARQDLGGSPKQVRR